MTPYILHVAVRRFLKTLPSDLKSKCVEHLLLLETFGRLLAPPDSKKVNKNLFELRIQGSVQVRLLYGFSDDTAFVVNGFVKKSQKIPPRELQLAHKRFIELAQQ